MLGQIGGALWAHLRIGHLGHKQTSGTDWLGVWTIGERFLLGAMAEASHIHIVGRIKQPFQRRILKQNVYKVFVGSCDSQSASRWWFPFFPQVFNCELGKVPAGVLRAGSMIRI